MKVKGKYRLKKRFFLVLLVLAYVFFNFGRQFYRIHTLDQAIDGYGQNKVALVQEQKKLQEEIGLLDNHAYIERIAREDLGLIKPGETLLVPGQTGNVREAKSLNSVSGNIH